MPNDLLATMAAYRAIPTPARPITIRVVDSEACPTCRTDGDGFNRPKSHDGRDWWWKCYNQSCDTNYYLPRTGEVEKNPTPDEAASMAERAKAHQKFLALGTWEPLPNGQEGARFVPAKTPEAYELGMKAGLTGMKREDYNA